MLHANILHRISCSELNHLLRNIPYEHYVCCGVLHIFVGDNLCKVKHIKRIEVFAHHGRDVSIHIESKLTTIEIVNNTIEVYVK